MLRYGRARWVDREVGKLEGREVGRWGSMGPRGQIKGAAPLARHTSAAWAAAPLLCDLEWAGQGWALQPHTADLTSLQEIQGQ